MYSSIIAGVTKLFSHSAGKNPTVSEKNFYHSAAYRYGKRATIVNYAVNPEMFINISALEGIKSLVTNEENTASEIELRTRNLVRRISTDEGYHSMLDCAGRKQIEEQQQQSCCDDGMIKQIKAKHFRAVKDLEEKLEESNAKGLRYCHEIAVLKNHFKAEKEEIKKIKAQYLLTIKDLEEQLQKSKMNNVKCYQEIETLRNDNNTSKQSIIKLQAIVQGQSMKLQQIKENKASKIHVIEIEHHESLKTKQNKISDLEKCKTKLQELEIKQKKMLEVQKECELIVKQKKTKVVELRKDCERKVHEVKQWKAICALKQHDERKVEESYQKIMKEVLKEMAKIQVKQKMDIGGKPTIVQIKLFGAKDLLICGRDGTSDPYCTIGIIKEENKGMLMMAAASMKEFYITKEYLNQLNCQNSSVAHNTVNPIWNEQFELFATNFGSCVLAFEVWDNSENDVVKLRDMKLVMRDVNLSDDKSTACIGGEGDDYMGRAFLTALMIKTEPIEWVLPLYSRNRKRKYGELRVCVNSVTI